MEQKHSRIGIVSFIIAITIVIGSAVFLLLAGTGIIGKEMEEPVKHKLVMLWLNICLIIPFAAFIIGIVGLFIKTKRKNSRILAFH